MLRIISATVGWTNMCVLSSMWTMNLCEAGREAFILIMNWAMGMSLQIKQEQGKKEAKSVNKRGEKQERNFNWRWRNQQKSDRKLYSPGNENTFYRIDHLAVLGWPCDSGKKQAEAVISHWNIRCTSKRKRSEAKDDVVIIKYRHIILVEIKLFLCYICLSTLSCYIINEEENK